MISLYMYILMTARSCGPVQIGFHVYVGVVTCLYKLEHDVPMHSSRVDPTYNRHSTMLWTGYHIGGRIKNLPYQIDEYVFSTHIHLQEVIYCKLPRISYEKADIRCLITIHMGKRGG